MRRTAPAVIGILMALALPALAAAQGAIAPRTSNLVGAGRWTLSAGTLPPGMSLDPATGAITGQPTALGSYRGLKLTVRDSQNAEATSQEFAIEVTRLPIAVTVPATVPAVRGQPLTVTATSNAVGTATWSLREGTLPPGMALDASTGSIAGAPTAVGTYGGLVAAVRDSTGTTGSSVPFAIVVSDAVTPGQNGTCKPVGANNLGCFPYWATSAQIREDLPCAGCFWAVQAIECKYGPCGDRPYDVTGRQIAADGEICISLPGQVFPQCGFGLFLPGNGGRPNLPPPGRERAPAVRRGPGRPAVLAMGQVWATGAAWRRTSTRGSARTERCPSCGTRAGPAG